MSNQPDFEFSTETMAKHTFDQYIPKNNIYLDNIINESTFYNLNECCICFEEMDTNCIKTNCCSQNIHKTCLSIWCKNSFDKKELATCPLCNTKFDSSYLFKISLYKKFINLIDNCCDGNRKV